MRRARLILQGKESVRAIDTSRQTVKGKVSKQASGERNPKKEAREIHIEKESRPDDDDDDDDDDAKGRRKDEASREGYS